jgi:hypothetical protein
MRDPKITRVRHRERLIQGWVLCPCAGKASAMKAEGRKGAASEPNLSARSAHFSILCSRPQFTQAGSAHITWQR